MGFRLIVKQIATLAQLSTGSHHWHRCSPVGHQTDPIAADIDIKLLALIIKYQLKPKSTFN